MSTYERILLAFGIPESQARRDAWANEMQRFNNRDHARYGTTEREAAIERPELGGAIAAARSWS